MKVKVNSIFEGIQGEGRYQGFPALFIRLSGCNRKCSWCDTKYHTAFTLYEVEDLIEIINKINKKIIIFTGGEPLLQNQALRRIISQVKDKYFQLETNGDFLDVFDFFLYDYIAVSPKDVETAEKVVEYTKEIKNIAHYDIKIVTDLDKVGLDLLPYATALMPLTTYDKKKDLEIKKKVWKYCISKNLFYSGRLNVEVWGNEKGK